MFAQKITPVKSESTFREKGLRAQSSKLIAQGFSTIAAALREIFDESAYARFLRRTRQPSSRTAYRAFLAELSTQKQRRPRCC